jgi:hypothetical protein
VQAPIWDVDPNCEQAWLDGERAKLGDDRYRQELGADFVSGAGQFFDLRGIDFEAGPVAPEDGRRWVCGMDPAYHGDRYGLALVGESAHEPGLLVVGAVDAIEPKGAKNSREGRRQREDTTLAKVWSILEPYAERGLRIASDQHDADAVRSYFGRLGCAVTIHNLTGPLQSSAFTAVRTRLMDGSLRLWRHPLLIEELRRVRAKDTERIDLPRFGGGHCDAASALSLAVYEQRHVQAGGARGRFGSGPPVYWNPEGGTPAEPTDEQREWKPLPGSEWKHRRSGSRLRSGFGRFEP